ncbi:MAG: CoA transferase, partial [Pigmentiphaga sp.]
MPEQTLPALHGYIVLELGLAEAGQYAGRLLADLGARVISIEPREGVSTRWIPPFARDSADRQRSIVHEYLNAGKESIAVDIHGELLTSVLRVF